MAPKSDMESQLPSFNIDDDDDGLVFEDAVIDGFQRPEDWSSVLTRFKRRVSLYLSHPKSICTFFSVGGLAAFVLLVLIIFGFSGIGQSGEDHDHAGEGLIPGHKHSPEKDVNLAQLSMDDLYSGDLYVNSVSIYWVDYVDSPVSAKDGIKAETLTKRAEDDGDGDGDDNDSEDDEEHDADTDDEEEDEEDDHDHDDDNESDNDKDKDKISYPVNNDPGFYIRQLNANIYLFKASDPKYKKHIVDFNALSIRDSNPVLVSFTKSFDKIIVMGESEKQWRHSSRAYYWIVDTTTLEVTSVYTIDDPNDATEKIPASLYYAAFSPDENYIYFNYKGNIYLRDSKLGKINQITKDSDDENIFNGKPDWVYEEEVLASDRAITWNSDGSMFAFIKWDDTEVPVYNLENIGYGEYPTIEKLKYPKPGFPNPVVSLHMYNVKKGKLQNIKQPFELEKDLQSLGKEFIIYQVAWVTDNDLIFKITDRTSTMVHVNVYHADEKKSHLVRNFIAGSYGWYKNNGPLYVLPNNEGYIDTVVLDGHDHLAYFESSDTVSPVYLSSGDWDVLNGVVGYDKYEKAVYFIGTSGNALQRQIYKSSLVDSQLSALTDLNTIHSYSLSVSTNGGWGLMKYNGPDIPSQKIVDLPLFFHESNYYQNLPNMNNAEQVSKNLGKYNIPQKEYHVIKLADNTTIDVIEVRPVSVYGGPGAQKLNCNFGYGFEEIVSSSLEVIVLYIDPRGTGGRGWDFQYWARKSIGYWEPRDIVEATEIYANKNDFVDISKIAIWGWSYGGFTTLKTLEYDQGRVFSYGMAVAPVTDWLLYDSIYTERYMGSPNDSIYEDASIRDYNAFSKLQRFLIMHGSADDNVHIQNTLKLINSFDLAGVENYDMHIYPDSDHSINHDNAQRMVFDRLFSWLTKNFDI
ncbi:Ste13 protein [Martiniozyma asiatica (nom. inval.)]|nr:Ste13 protein [Martiniozyma asiatica]